MAELKVTFVGRDEMIQKFASMLGDAGSALQAEMVTQMTRLADYVRRQKLQGSHPEFLEHRTGNLSRSITGSASVNGPTITGRVGTTVNYAPIHEFGLTIAAHSRTISQVFGRPVIPHEIDVKAYTMPKRAFVGPSMTEQRAVIVDALKRRAMQLIKNGS